MNLPFLTHSSWPYPRSREQVVRLSTVGSILALIALVAFGAWLRIDQTRTFEAKDLQQLVEKWQSYAHEAKLLALRPADNLSTPYRQTYLTELSENVDQDLQQLRSHKIRPEITNQRQRLETIGQHLTNDTRQLARKHDSSYARDLQTLYDSLEHLKEPL